MRMSEEQKRRLRDEEDNELKLPWMTYREFNQLTPRQKSRELQKATQSITSYMGFWKTCDLSPCRRARRCKCFLAEAQYSGKPRWHDAFPPCVGPGGARHAEVLAYARQLEGRMEDGAPKYDGRRDADGQRER